MSSYYVGLSDFCETKSTSLEMKIAMFGCRRILKDNDVSIEKKMDTLDLLRHLHSRISH